MSSKTFLMLMVLGVLGWVPTAMAASGGGPGGGGFDNGGMGNGGSIGGGKHRSSSPGSAGGLPWASMDLKAARDLKKPIILYVYDEKVKKENHTVIFFENEVFSDPDVQKTLKGFTCVLVPSSAEWLPAVFIARAQGGAAVFLMTFDGSIHRFWNVGNRPQVNEFADVAKTVAISNPKVLERFDKDQPLKLKFPNGQAVDLKPAAVEAPKGDGPTVYSITPDEGARQDVIKRLAAEIAAGTKAGEKLKAWLTLGSKKEELGIETADAKNLSLSVQGNVLPIKWEKLDKEEIYDLSKNIAGEKSNRLLLAAEMAMALGHADEAIAILAKARVIDPNVAAQVDTLAGRIKKSGGEAAPAAAQETPKAETPAVAVPQEAPKTAEANPPAQPEANNDQKPVEIP